MKKQNQIGGAAARVEPAQEDLADATTQTARGLQSEQTGDSKDGLLAELSRFQIAYDCGLERDVEPISRKAIVEGLALLKDNAFRYGRPADHARNDARSKRANASLSAAPAAENLRNETRAAMGVVNQETGLLPCPFCGSLAVLIDPDSGMHDVEEWTAICVQCGVRQGGDFREDAIAAWNRRAPLISSLPQTPVVTTKGKE